MSDQISIIIVDDHPLFREGVVSTLIESGYFDVVAQSDSQDDAIVKCEKFQPDLLLLDIKL